MSKSMRRFVMRLWVTTLALAALASMPGVARAQVTAAPPLVLVIDSGRARVSPDRLLAAMARATGRVVVRITDARARDSAGTLTLAYEGAATWMVRFDSRGLSATTQERIARPGALDATLVAAAVRMLADVDAQRAAADATTRPRDDSSFYVAWTDEILDPFVGAPPQRRELAIYSEVIDPFAPAAARRAGWTEVLDPWGR